MSCTPHHPRREAAAVAAACLALASGAAHAQSRGTQQFRSITGHDNNLQHPSWGAANTNLIRCDAGAFYGGPTGMWEMGGENRLSPRVISNIVFSQSGLVFDDIGRTDLVWQWGQFIDHDLALTPTSGLEDAPILIPTGDPWFDPASTGGVEMHFIRSIYDQTTGVTTPREQIGTLTAFVDASQVYGSANARANWLRTHSGGRMKVANHPTGDLLPFNDGSQPNDNGPFGAPASSMFVSGDIRTNEQSGLAVMHTLWVREHNRLADIIAANNPSFDDETIFQYARAIVIAETQVITYEEFLPILLGPDALPPYTGYDPSVNPSVANEFAASLYRVGHTMLSSEIHRLGEGFQPHPDGNLNLREMFFRPSIIVDEGGIEPILRGMASSPQQRVDTLVIDDVRNFLFGQPGAGGLDLVALNLQRGRDHGLPDYNTVRASYGLPARTIDEITSDQFLRDALFAAYGDASDIDLWVGALAEDHVPGAAVGEVMRVGVADQFRRARDGDRFFYANPDHPSDLVSILAAAGMTMADLEAVRLGHVIRDNTSIQRLHDYVMLLRMPGDTNGDGSVDFSDLNIVLNGFGQQGLHLEGDANFDLRVDFADLNAVLTGFGQAIEY